MCVEGGGGAVTSLDFFSDKVRVSREILQWCDTIEHSSWNIWGLNIIFKEKAATSSLETRFAHTASRR